VDFLIHAGGLHLSDEEFEFKPIRKCRLLLFFKDEESWKKYKDIFNNSTLKQVQWEGGVYLIATGVDISLVKLDELKNDESIYKIIFSEEG
jgi:hypothetical protein